MSGKTPGRNNSGQVGGIVVMHNAWKGYIGIMLFNCTCIWFHWFPGFNRLDVEVFVNKNQGIPAVIKFHPYEGHVAVADKDGIWSVVWIIKL